jgi:uncharacterized RDD family membrane protein YckC
MGRRLALLIATYQYHDAGLRQLTAPAHDAESLATVLQDRDIAGFEVTTLINEPHHRVGEVIGDFYRDRRRDDLTLLYFTGHGVKDDDGRLYLAMANTRRDSLLFTSLSAEQIDHAMSGCPSRQQVLILDCCYSGAFPAGRLAKADTDVHALDRFRGRGRTVLTASDATQYSFEGNQLHGEAAQSVFTRYLVAGLRDGSADLDGDGDITLDELYSYAYARVVEEMPQQRPKKQDNVEGRTIIARNINWSLPAYLRNALRSPIATDRLGALDGLDHLYRIGNDAVRACVRDEIHRLTDDDSKMVSTSAAQRLRSILPQPPEQVPDVSEPEAKKAPESPATRATTPRARQAGFSVPAVVPAKPPDPPFPTAEPPLQPAIEFQPPPSAATEPGLSTEKSGSEPAVHQRLSAPPGSEPGFGASSIGQLPGPLADFGARVRSFLIDLIAGVLGLIAFAVWNSGYRQGTTGQSIGRRITKTKLVKIETGEPIGFGMALLRQICLTVTLGIGYLWPLWDPKRQTVADKIVKAVVVSIDKATTEPPAIELQSPPSTASRDGCPADGGGRRHRRRCRSAWAAVRRLAGRRPTRRWREWRSAPPGIGQLPGPLAGFGARVPSFLIDIVAPCIAFSAAVTVIIAGASEGDDEFVMFGVALLIPFAAFLIWNSGYRQGMTGQSIGRRVTKTKLVKIETGEPIGFGMALLRLICVAVMLIPYGLGIGYLWSLWDPKRQTVADKVVKAVVVRIDDPTT